MLEIPASGEPGCGVGMRRWPWWSRPAESISSASSSGSVRQGRPENASELFPLVHTLFANMKTWINGTFHGVSKTWLPAYVQEFAYRLNRRSQSHDGVLWQFLLRRMGEGHVARLGDPRRGDGAAQGGVNARPQDVSSGEPLGRLVYTAREIPRGLRQAAREAARAVGVHRKSVVQGGIEAETEEVVHHRELEDGLREPLDPGLVRRVGQHLAERSGRGVAAFAGVGRGRGRTGEQQQEGEDGPARRLYRTATVATSPAG
jgi:hypothetical protein